MPRRGEARQRNNSTYDSRNHLIAEQYRSARRRRQAAALSVNCRYVLATGERYREPKRVEQERFCESTAAAGRLHGRQRRAPGDGLLRLALYRSLHGRAFRSAAQNDSRSATPSQSGGFLTRLRFAPRRSALRKSAPRRSASLRSAFSRSAWRRFALSRSARRRSASRNSARLRSALRRSAPASCLDLMSICPDARDAQANSTEKRTAGVLMPGERIHDRPERVKARRRDP